jgi:hypothetical protein
VSNRNLAQGPFSTSTFLSRYSVARRLHSLDVTCSGVKPHFRLVAELCTLREHGGHAGRNGHSEAMKRGVNFFRMIRILMPAPAPTPSGSE